MEIIFKPEGDLLDIETWDDFARTLIGLAELPVVKISLDLSLVNRISSSYIGTILNTFKNLNEQGKELALTNVSPKLYALLEMLKLTEMIPVKKA